MYKITVILVAFNLKFIEKSGNNRKNLKSKYLPINYCCRNEFLKVVGAVTSDGAVFKHIYLKII